MIKLIEQLHQITKLNNFNFVPGKEKYMLFTVNFLGHEFGNQTIKPVNINVEAIHTLKLPTNKRELMKFICSLNFYSKFIENLHFSLISSYTLLLDKISFTCTCEIKTVFKQVKISPTKDAG